MQTRLKWLSGPGLRFLATSSTVYKLLKCEMFILIWMTLREEAASEFTLQPSFDEASGVGHREDVTHVEHFAHVNMKKLQAAGEGHPEELHLPPLLLGEALVSQTWGEMVAGGCGQILGLFPCLSQLLPQLQVVRATANARGQLPVARHHLRRTKQPIFSSSVRRLYTSWGLGKASTWSMRK